MEAETYHFWKNLELEIQEKIKAPVKVIIPNELTKEYIKWFFKIEKKAFSESLRYTKEELQARFLFPGRLFFFLVLKKKPIAVLLGYKDSSETSNLFYLDTIATIVEKKGIATLIIKYLINWVKLNGYFGIKLDTDLLIHRGMLLRNFYQKFGFRIINEDIRGDITMEYFF